MKAFRLLIKCGLPRRIVFSFTVAFCLLLAGVAPAASLGTWAKRTPGTAENIKGIAFGNGTFVAVGTKGCIATSPDGVKWTKRSAGITRDFNDVTFSQGRFIAVCKAPDTGSGAKIWISDTNGASWKYRDTDASGDVITQGLHSVTSDANGNLVAVGGGWAGQVTVSHDNGTTWNRKAGTWSPFYGVVYGKNQWIAVGSGGPIRSIDGGTTWNQFAGPDGFKIAFGAGRFVVTPSNSTGLKWSQDGLNWKNATKASEFASDSFGWTSGCVFADGMFVVTEEFSRNIWTSENGRAFKKWESPGTAYAYLLAAAFGNRTYLCGGYKGLMCASPPWLRARLGGPWDHPFTAFDAEDSPPKKIALPEYRVNTSSLNLHLEATLFHMPTLSAAMSFRLSYTSSPVEDSDTSIGPFGKNWRSSYESMLGSFGQEVRLITGGGNSLFFTTPNGEDLSTITTGSLKLESPAGSQDELTYYGPTTGFKLVTRATRMTYHYAAKGGPGDALWFLTRIEDRSGNAVVLNVTTDAVGGRVNSVTDPAGRQLIFNYSAGRCVSLLAPDGRSLTFTYDSHHNLSSISDMAGYQAKYTYDEAGFLKIMDTAGRINRFAWKARPGYEDKTSEQENAGDMIISTVTTSSGSVIKYELLTDGGVKRTDARGMATVFNSAEGRTTGITNPKGSRTKVTFNEQKLPASFTDELGNVTEVEYNDTGSPVLVTDAAGHQTHFTYDARSNLTSRTDPLLRKWQFTYTGNNNLSSARSPLNHVTNYDYHSNGRLWKITDPLLGQTVQLYNGEGDLTSQTDASGQTTTFNYDGVSRCTAMTDRAGRSKSIQYDANDRITRIQYTSAPGVPERVFSYDAFGQTGYTDELGNITAIARNDFGYITSITDALGNLTQTDYNPENLPERITDPLGRVTSTAYDTNGRPIKVTDPLGRITTREYNAQGGLTKLTDARKAATTFTYDENDRLLSMTDPLGKKVQHERDALGRVTTTTNARGEQIRVTYDEDGRVTKKESKAATSGAVFVEVAGTSMDANSNLTSRKDDWGTATWTYDASNRATAIAYPGGKSAQFTYTATGQIASITYPGGLVVTYTYDSFNRQKIPSVFRSGSEVIGAKEPTSNVTAMSLSLNSETAQVTYQHDFAGRLVDVSRTLLPASASTIHSTYTYDALGRPTRMKHDVPAGTAFDWLLSYDAVGNVITETHDGDANSLPLLPVPAAFTYDLGGRIKTRAGVAHTYDADGNLTTIAGGLFQATYTSENRPLSIQRKIGTETEISNHLYDGSGMRVRRQTGAETIHYHYGPGNRLLFTTDGAGTVLTSYVWSDRGLVAAVKGTSLTTGLQHYLTGRLMSVVGLTDAAGTLLATYSYDPLGQCARQVRQVGFVDDNPFTFVGGLGVLDEGAGLYYMRQRFYDAQSGRFLQKDPAGFEGGINLYAYASGNPVNAVDAAGTWDVNWGVFWKGTKQLAYAAVGVGVVAVSAPVGGALATAVMVIGITDTALNAGIGLLNVTGAVLDAKNAHKTSDLDNFDSTLKIFGNMGGAMYTGVKSVATGQAVNEKELQENMNLGSKVGSTANLALGLVPGSIPDGHVLNSLNNVMTADSIGQAYGESAAVLIKESQEGEQPAPQANAPADDSNLNWGGND